MASDPKYGYQIRNAEGNVIDSSKEYFKTAAEAADAGDEAMKNITSTQQTGPVRIIRDDGAPVTPKDFQDKDETEEQQTTER